MDYAATKGAESNFMVSLPLYFASKGVRVNDVALGPSWVSLQLDNGKLGLQIPDFDPNTPLGRAGQQLELVPVYVLLAPM